MNLRLIAKSEESEKLAIVLRGMQMRIGSLEGELGALKQMEGNKERFRRKREVCEKSKISDHIQ
jgi:hypothetical protein